VLVNNAGYGHLSFFEEASQEDIRTQFETNVFGLFQVTQAALPVMRKPSTGGSSTCPRSAACAASNSARSIAPPSSPSRVSRNRWPRKWRRSASSSPHRAGPFRTDFLTTESLRFGGKTIANTTGAARRSARPSSSATASSPAIRRGSPRPWCGLLRRRSRRFASSPAPSRSTWPDQARQHGRRVRPLRDLALGTDYAA